MTENRIIVDKTDMKRIYNDLKSRGFSRNDISREIGARFDSALYHGYSMSETSFHKLESLYGKKIAHKSKNCSINIKGCVKGGKANNIYNELTENDLKEWIKLYENLRSFRLVRE